MPERVSWSPSEDPERDGRIAPRGNAVFGPIRSPSRPSGSANRMAWKSSQQNENERLDAEARAPSPAGRVREAAPIAPTFLGKGQGRRPSRVGDRGSFRNRTGRLRVWPGVHPNPRRRRTMAPSSGDIGQVGGGSPIYGIRRQAGRTRLSSRPFEGARGVSTRRRTSPDPPVATRIVPRVAAPRDPSPSRLQSEKTALPRLGRHDSSAGLPVLPQFLTKSEEVAPKAATGWRICDLPATVAAVSGP